MLGLKGYRGVDYIAVKTVLSTLGVVISWVKTRLMKTPKLKVRKKRGWTDSGKSKN